MLSLFKPYALPVEIEKHDYVIVEDCQQPLAKVELTESEKKVGYLLRDLLAKNSMPSINELL
jgi:hypothetical protein